ncbi:hypothetical protein D3C80_2024420 [compost metagenome]
MQFIEQGFEFVFADVIAGWLGCRRRRLGRSSRQRIDGKGALAMQLVKQRFEFVIGDFVAGTLGRYRFRHRGRRKAVGGELAFAV